MKKLLVVFLAVVLVSGAAFAQTNVTSVNIVGFARVDLLPQGAFNLLSLPFDSIDPEDANLLGVFGTNTLYKNTRLSRADKVWLFTATPVPEWKQYYQKPDLLFYDESGSVANPPIFPGEGFFVETSTEASQTTTNTIALMGEVITGGSKTNQVVEGFQALGYPYSSSSVIDDLTLTDLGAANSRVSRADKIWLYDAATGEYVGYYLKDVEGVRGWYLVSDSSGPVNVNVSMGQGFWYEAVAGTLFNWVQPTPYPNL